MAIISDLEADRIYRLSHGERSAEEQRGLDRWRVEQVKRNADPEAKIEQMVRELAYERVKHSCLFNEFGNSALDRKADELAGEITRLLEYWITREVNARVEYQNSKEHQS